MLEALAIAALVVGGVSSATLVTDDEAVQEVDRQPSAVEMTPERQAHPGNGEASENPFID
ncbi:hypothetical protein [uncultured Thiohalocapsa sp.]|uniref:hypothetical protein n=1 Tax=uncultured Thiohalocapsa sp. TaxID=768990 RepID=UPI0025FFAE53|nr:hypothetical protein [uncultured Thiohalocapsa sp.]